MRKKSKFIVGTVILSFFASTLYSGREAFAYTFNNTLLTNPKNTAICCQNRGYMSRINTYAKKWNQLPELYLYTTSNAAAASIVSDVANRDEGPYAETHYDGGGHASIMFYRKWIQESESVQNETIVHEYGHAVGLGHTQKNNDPRAVMREYGFNNKAYPLADDKAGIAALY